jgi:sugar O-acyltransferase (sialic acid O-acetyltransferase NeuD family)
MVVVGAGGHSKVVLDALFRSGFDRTLLSVIEGDLSRRGQDILGIEIRSDADPLPPGYAFHVAVGDGTTRQRIHEKHGARGGRAVSIIHPDASVSTFATIEPGVFIAAGSVVGPAALVALGAIINHRAVVDHDCVLGEFCHVAPNATLGGAVTVGARVLIGAGATILPGVKIGNDAVIGAGAVVVRNVEAGETHIGVPARRTARRLK